MEEIVEKLKDIIAQENEKLYEKLHQEMNENMNDFRQEMKEDMNYFRQEMKDDMNDFRQEMKDDMNDFRQEMKDDMNDFRQEIKEDMNNLRQEMNDLSKQILDRQFVFETEYGTKIDAIFEYVQFHQKTNLKRFDRIDDLEKRMEVTQIHNFDHEKRISALERKSV